MRTFLTGLLLTVAATTPVAHAADADGYESAERIRAIVAEFVHGQRGAATQVQVGALDSRVQMPRCEQPPRAFVPAGESSRDAFTVGVRCDGPVSWALYVPVRIDERRQVLVLTRPVSRGETLSADSVSAQAREGGSLGYGYFSDPVQINGKIVTRAMAAGTVLTPDAVQSARVVRRGQTVLVIGRSGGIEVRTQGVALDDAGVGDRVQVRNASSRRLVDGIVSGTDTVVVTL